MKPRPTPWRPTPWRPTPWRLSHRLAWRLAAVLLGAILVAAAGVAWRSVATIRSLDDAALQSQARLVAGQVAIGPDGRPVLHLPAALARDFAATDGQNLFIVYDARGQVIASSDPRAPALVASFLPPGNGLFRVGASDDYPDGLLAAAVTAGGARVVVAQAQEQTEALVASLLRAFLESALWLLLPIAALTVLIAVLTLRNGLRPLRQASAAAAGLGPARPGLRLPAAGLPGEVLPLVEAVNDGLARLELSLDAQRRFVAAAAHALRTPLAVLSARIDALPEAARPGLREDADRMARLVGQLLAMARIEELPLDRSAPLDLHAIAVEAISDLAPLAIRGGVELVLTEPQALPPLSGNRAAVTLALSNLLDNALAHAPAGSAVEVVLSPGAIRVRDRGPGVPEPEREAIFGRFQRGSAARPGGSGLGLALVAEIAAAHGGKAWVEPREGGGAEFVMTLG